MALSKKSLKRNYGASKVINLLILSAARRMSKAAEEYNATFQQRMSSKHYPEQAQRDAVRLHGHQLWLNYRKARSTFFNLRRKHGVAFTNRVLRNIDTKPARTALLREMLDSKPGWARKQICGTTKQFFGCAVLPETTDALKVGEMTFKQAVVLFSYKLIKTLMVNKRLSYRDAKQIVENYDNNKAVLLVMLHEAIEQQELNVCFVRHKTMPSNTPFKITKITDI